VARFFARLCTAKAALDSDPEIDRGVRSSGTGPGRWACLVQLAAGTGLGLLVSAAAASEDVALALVPVVVIPQIVLAGVVPLLSGVGKAAAGAATCYWG